MYGDFTDKPTLAGALKGVEDVVLLASLVGDPICKKYSDLARHTNRDGSIELINRLADHKNVKRFVFASTCSNYGLRTDDSYATEEASLNPVSLYAETKVAVEQHILANKSSLPFAATVLRLSTAHGLSARMRFDLTISEFTRALALNEDLLVYDENTWRPYCHVNDISAAIRTVLAAAPEKVAGEVFNTGSTSENFTKKSIIEIVQEFLTDVGKVRYKEGGLDPRNYRVSFDKIEKVLGFRTEFGVRRSVPHLIQAVRSGCFADVEQRKNFYGNYVIG
jgi:nucleoside-diphosphate-sugar epimerase